MRTQIIPLSPKRSARRTCSVKTSGSAMKRCDVGFGVAPRGQVELVGLVDQLRMRARSTRRMALQLHHHLERRAGSRPSRGSRPSTLGARGVAGIGICARRSSSPESRPPRNSRPAIDAGIPAAIVRQLGHGHHRELRRAPGPARPGCRRANTSASRPIFSVLAMLRDWGLVVPVRLEDRDVASREQHLRDARGTASRAFASSFLEQTARMMPRCAEPAHNCWTARRPRRRRCPGRARCLQPVIADHAAPERVVEVEHEAFARLAADRPEQAAEHVRKVGVHSAANGSL